MRVPCNELKAPETQLQTCVAPVAAPLIVKRSIALNPRRLCSSKAERLSGSHGATRARARSGLRAPIGRVTRGRPRRSWAARFALVGVATGRRTRGVSESPREGPKRPANGAQGPWSRLRVIFDLAWRPMLLVLVVYVPYPRRRRDGPSEVFRYSPLQATLSGVQWAQQTRAGCPTLLFKAQSNKLCKMKLILIFVIF